MRSETDLPGFDELTVMLFGTMRELRLGIINYKQANAIANLADVQLRAVELQRKIALEPPASKPKRAELRVIEHGK